MKEIIGALDRTFEEISKTSRELILATPEALLFRDLRDYPSTAMCSVGEYVVRSAAMVEVSFGGLTRRLWDDPFEWTLPEELYAAGKILEYLDEVDAQRRDGLLFIKSDDELSMVVPAPIQMKSIAAVMFETIGLARHYQGRAFAMLQVASDVKLPRL